ncbi:radical SAM/SPASM domain-containing protein [Pseudolabrys taiwanensis]|nr:radical SAM protein [Pseudolabrys taiwanensis]
MVVEGEPERRQRPVRSIPDEGLPEPQPRYVVWEITLSCNLKCRHCGSRAGAPRRQELSTAECLALIDELALAGTKEAVLIGGEAYLRQDWLELVAAFARHGILCGLQTGGRALTEAKIAAAARAGLKAVGVSIDGSPATHDDLRGVKGSHAQAVAAIRHSRRQGLMTTANSQVNRRNVGELRDIFDTIIDAGASAWQVQLTVPMGNAADDPNLILQPYELATVLPELFALFREGIGRGLQLIPGNNIGYFGPYESAWRSTSGRAEYYGGCQAGRAGLGIEADGAIKGCPSLPTAPYAGGNVRDKPFGQIWRESAELAFMRDPVESSARRWGFCKKCYYGPTCRGGCNWTTHVVTNKPGNNPFCHYRILRLMDRGWREIIVHREAPPEGAPFDFGRFDIMVEDEHGQLHGQDVFDRDDVQDIAPGANANLDALVLCERCDRFHYQDEAECPHCRSWSAVDRANQHLDEIGKILSAINASPDASSRVLPDSVQHGRSVNECK